MLLNKLFSLCIVLTSWNIYANLALTKGKRIIISYEENNVTTFFFTSVFYEGVLTLWGFCLGRHRQGQYRFSSILFSVLLSFLPADFTFYNANSGCMVLSFSTVSWSVGLGDIFNGIWQLMELISLKGDLICGMNVVTLNSPY